MISRLSLSMVALLAGVALASFIPALSQWARTIVAFSSALAPKNPEATSDESKSGTEARDEQQGIVKLTGEEIEAAGIEVAVVQGGTIAHRIIVPGTIVPHADRIAHVAVKLSSIVAELRKNIGDPVEKNDVLAMLFDF
jgi:cobalt-zinc-cadmium efflux system membrane fusion protein